MDNIKRNRLAFKIGILGVFFLLLLGDFHLFAQCGTKWGITHYDRSYTYVAVATNGSRIVVVGYEEALYSDDGVHWNIANKPFKRAFTDVVYAEGKYVAVGGSNHCSTSADGSSWVERRFIKDSKWLWGVTHAEGTFIAFGENGQVLTSPDGITWTDRNNGISERLQSAAYGNSLLVAVGTSGGIYSSADVRVSWTKRADAPQGLMSAAYGNNTFVVGGRDGLVYTSSNGTSWTKRNPGVTNFFRDIAYTSYAGFVAVGNRGTNTYCMIMTSPDGVSWTSRNNYVTSELLGVGANDDMIVAAGGSFVEVSMCTPLGDIMDVAAPNGGEEWSKGSIRYIRWGSFGTVGNVELEYSVDNGDNWTTIVASTTNDSKYAWTVPNASSSQCRVRVSEASDGSPSDTSDGTFTIGGVAVNTITVLSPNGGETWGAGSTHNITWKGSTTFSKVDIEYYNGASWNVIVTGTADDGVHPWKIPDISTSNARIWIKGYDGGTNPTDYSNSTFTITGGQSTENTITLTAPNGGETLTGGNNYSIKWTGSVAFSKIDIEYYDGNKWNVIVTGTKDDGVHNWTVPDISTSNARIWIKGYDGGINPTDYSDDTFTISLPPSGSLTVTSPNGNEVWAKGSTENITWTSSGEVGNVRIYYSTDSGFQWTTIVSSTSNDGSYAWTLPDIIADTCLVKIRAVGNSQISDVSNDVFSIGGPPQIVLSKTRFNFGYIKNGASPCTQTLFISNGGGGTLNWSADADASWINLSSTSGTGGGIVTIAINTIGLNTGSYMGTITVSDPDVENSPQTAQVYLTVKNGSQDEEPFGIFATPEDGLTGVAGSIAVTGWVLDDTCVESVEIFREVNGELSFIGDAVFVEGARPDVEEAYPDYPNNSRAGWGYMMLTNFLPDGQLVLKAIAKDTSGQQVELGTKTITVDNEHADKPFGAIDTPDQGGEAFGTKYRNNGWALTPQPNKVPESGLTIQVFIDSVPVGNADYNLYRSDIAELFAGYANSNGAWAYFDFDTTVYTNGVHTIAWSVTDSAGNTDGIGSRYFSILNSGGASGSSARTAAAAAFGEGFPPRETPVDHFEPVAFRKGYNRYVDPQVIHPGEGGAIYLGTGELEPIEIHLPGVYAGSLVVGSQLRPLPIGSSLDTKKGIFYWLPGPGFLGNYEFIFLKKQKTRGPIKMKIHLEINSKPVVKVEEIK